MPEVDPQTAELLAEIRARRELASPGQIPRATHYVTPQQIERASRLTPDWMDEILPELVAYTLAHLGGQRKSRARLKHAFVFAFGGQEFAGVHDAADPWLDGFPGLREMAEEHGWRSHTTPATYLGKIAGKGIAGASPNRPHVKGPPDPHPDLPLYEVEDEVPPEEVSMGDMYERFADGGD